MNILYDYITSFTPFKQTKNYTVFTKWHVEKIFTCDVDDYRKVAVWTFHTFQTKETYNDLLKQHDKNMLICDVDDHKNT